MNGHSFHFRCKACNRKLHNKAFASKGGLIKESDLCSVCTSLASDDSEYREYQHQDLTDVLTPYTPSPNNNLD